MGLVVALLVVGLVLLLLETIVPGLVIGILGFCSLVAGVVLAYMRFGVDTGNTVLLIVGAVCVVGICLWVKYFPTSAVARVFVSTSQIGDLGVENLSLLNQSGVTCTPLRPSGTAIIKGQRIDVITEGAFIERDVPVKVVAVEGMRVVVRATVQS